jgi:hypothetical protein
LDYGSFVAAGLIINCSSTLGVCVFS